jgi:uncharacterized delta-60 repeat protein
MGRKGNVAVIARTVLAAGAAVLLALPGLATARPGRPGTLDLTFGRGGEVLAQEPMETAPSEFVAAASEPNGKLVLDLRRSTLETEQVREIEMRLANGAPDPSFGEGGRVTVEGGGGLAALANGDIVVGIRKCPDGTDSSVMELEPSGAAVSGFGQGGCVAPLPFDTEFVSVDAKGRILLVGSIEYCAPCGKGYPRSSEIDVARLLPDGGRDPSFGRDGVVRINADHVIEDLESGQAITGIAATGDGGVMISGSSLIRLDESGAAVKAYGKAGATTIPNVFFISPTVSYTQPDGAAVVASTENDPEERILVSRFGPDGRLDTSFGRGGTAALSPRSTEVGAIAPAPDGGILVAGRRGRGKKGCLPWCAGTAFVARLTATGQPDPTYGTAGVVELPSPPPHGLYPSSPSTRALLVGTDGSILAAGADQSNDAFAVSLNPDGGPNPAFAEGGTLIERHEEPAQLEATGLALGPNGEFIAGTRRSTASGLRPGFQLGFEPSGKQRPGATGTGAVETLSHGQIEPDGDGRVVIWGGETDDRTLRATEPEGEPLRTYGKNGVARFPHGFTPEAVAPAPGGGVAVVGGIGPRAMAVYRLGPSGRPVGGFGRHGLAQVLYPHGFAIAFAGLVESDGSVVLTGWVNGHVGAARLLPTGRLDRSFGHGGLVRGLLQDGAFGLLIAPWHGGVVIATMRRHAYSTARGMIRLDRRGHLVRGFGRHGVVHPADERPALALLTGRGRIVVVTDPEFERNYRGGGVKLRAYRPDGALDRSFGRDGLVAYGRRKPKKEEFSPAAAVEQPDGKIVIAGTRRFVGDHSKLELVRFR